MKGIFLVLDGVADDSLDVLGEKTPLQAAKTPNLDEISRVSRIGYCYPVKEGVAPDSSSALAALLGFNPNSVPRGPVEALGMGMKVTTGDLVLRTNFATIDGVREGTLLDRRAGRTLTNKEIKTLSKAINNQVKLPFKFEFKPGLHHRGVIAFKGGFSDNISEVDPDYFSGLASASSSGKIRLSQPLDDEDDSRLAADLVNNFIKQSHKVLDKHPINITRAKKGLYSANFLLCRGAGSEIPRLKKLKGRWLALTYTPFEQGLARAAKMDVKSFNYPKMKGIDVYANLYDGLRRSTKLIVKNLRKNKNKYDYFYIHIKETDIPGRDNKPLDKVRMIEMLDRRLFGFLKNFVEKNNTRLVITSGHATSCRMKAHTAAPVPILSYFPEGDGKPKEQRFTEESALSGKRISSSKLLEKTLFSRG